ncbi:MAG: DNA-protecting protein DprA, partial [Lachnospiraceae bacterium]|nr:DNA-protecting protein DprA [Lachnospiraceae bacterium]
MDENGLADKILFSKEAAEYLGITVQRLNKLVQEGKVMPLKKNASGTVFLIDELDKRKEEQAIFTQMPVRGDRGMFEIDTKEKQEALNYATLMNVLDYTEHKLEPLFEEFAKRVNVDVPISNPKVCDEYARFFNVETSILTEEYQNAYKAFTLLRRTDEIIKRGSQDYPALLAQTDQAPRFLYIRGKKSLLHEKRTVAVVGSREASEKAKENTTRLVKALGKNGITVVSGLAKGIDVTAHRAALDSGYNTISVIGTNLNQYYPRENEAVQREIEKRGLIISQFSPASKTQRWFFPLRNGVMSGISLATVIMEAGETSGALKQADFALKQGRQILIPATALEMKQITWPARYVQRGAHVVKTPID